MQDCGADAARYVLENVHGRRHGEFFVDFERRLVLAVVRRMVNESAPVFNRTAVVNRDLAASVVGLDVKLLEQVAEPDLARRHVHDQPHGAVLRMRAHVDDRPPEPRVGHRRASR